MRNMANDSAIAASLALQYGCPAEVLLSALLRDTGGEPMSPLAAALRLQLHGPVVRSEDGILRDTVPIELERSGV